MILGDPKILAFAFLGGIGPALFWLWFWLQEGRKKPQPKGLLLLIFILGMMAVIFVLPIQKLIQDYLSSYGWQLLSWATAEEIVKYLAVIIVVYNMREIKSPVDWPIYMITAALGFAALENAIFLIQPLSLGETTVGLLTGELRFLGSTLLHAVSSGIIGIALGLSLHFKKSRIGLYFAISLLLAITLHSTFNFFIIENNGSDFLKVFAFLWVVTIIVMLLFEKLRREE